MQGHLKCALGTVPLARCPSFMLRRMETSTHFVLLFFWSALCLCYVQWWSDRDCAAPKTVVKMRMLMWSLPSLFSHLFVIARWCAFMSREQVLVDGLTLFLTYVFFPSYFPTQPNINQAKQCKLINYKAAEIIKNRLTEGKREGVGWRHGRGCRVTRFPVMGSRNGYGDARIDTL